MEGFVTRSGNFRADLTSINFDRIWVGRGRESLPRVVSLTTNPRRTGIFFATDQAQPPMYLNGMPLSYDEVFVWDVGGAARQQRSLAGCQWGTLHLSREDLATTGYALTGRELIPPAFPQRLRPSPLLLSLLRNVHKAAGHLAETAPDILLNPEVGRAMEQALLEAMVRAVTGGQPVDVRTSHHNHRAVMNDLEEALQANSEEPLYMADLCRAAGVSYSTLRACCQEHLGMSPKRYLWLRRMHLARKALHRADPETTTVTSIATDWGFWELGRFSVAYRALFGESPSTTLHRPPHDQTPGENAGSPWEFNESA
jgi:AraC-like DNA-binding protein